MLAGDQPAAKVAASLKKREKSAWFNTRTVHGVAARGIPTHPRRPPANASATLAPSVGARPTAQRC